MKRRVIGAPDFLDISENEFHQCKSAHTHLLTVLNIEITFDLFLENYAEFERDYLDLSLRLSLFGKHGEPLGPYREMNRRLTNLLSSACLYLDQAPHNLNAIYGERLEHTVTFKQCCASQYDSSPAYRIMEALRDYAQHRGFPVHALTLKFERADTTPGSQLRAGLQLFVDVKRLAQDRRFKKTVLEELAARADQGHVNLTLLIREYVERLCTVHEFLRGRLSTDVASWDQTIIGALDRARGAFGEQLSGLAVVAEEEADDVEYLDVEFADIAVQPIEWRQQLEAKNRNLGSLSARYVTG
jgi:hypothetical protein